MLVVVQHRISDPGAFWGAAAKELPNLPPGIKLHSSLPNAEGNLASCVWEGETLEILRTYLEEKTGAYSKNEYMVVDVSKAMNPPK